MNKILKHWQIVRVKMKTERVRVVLGSVREPEKGAAAIASRFDRSVGNALVFHDYCPAGTYRNGQLYQGNQR